MFENRGQIKGLTEFYSKLFKELGYQSDIAVAGVDHIDINIFEKQVVDVFICDLSFGKDDSYEGLNVIQRIKREYPDLLVIANSSKNITHTTSASKIPSFDIFVHKSKIYDRKYKNYILQRLGELFKRNVYGKIDFDHSDVTKTFRDDKSKLAIESIIRTITFTSHTADSSTSVDKVILEPLEGGMSGSEVYRLTSYTKNGLQCINSVLKISSPKNAKKEKENYLNYVKWYLPYTWRAELIGFALSKNIGALCYSFVYNDDVKFNSLTHYIKKISKEHIYFAIENIFRPKFQRWYHDKNVQTDTNITEYYHHKWFENRVDAEPFFMSIVRDFDLSNPNYVNIKGVIYPMPNGFLLGIHRGIFKTCICHGDLNSNNILISNNNDLSFIDFQHTGRGHVFEDFVVFECSLRFYANFDITFTDLIDHEIQLSNGIITELPFSKEILLLRKYAIETTKYCDIDNYYLAIALCCYRLLRISKLRPWQNEQLTACLLANMKMLEQNEKNK